MASDRGAKGLVAQKPTLKQHAKADRPPSPLSPEILSFLGVRFALSVPPFCEASKVLKRGKARQGKARRMSSYLNLNLKCYHIPLNHRLSGSDLKASRHARSKATSTTTTPPPCHFGAASNLPAAKHKLPKNDGTSQVRPRARLPYLDRSLPLTRVFGANGRQPEVRSHQIFLGSIELLNTPYHRILQVRYSHTMEASSDSG